MFDQLKNIKNHHMHSLWLLENTSEEEGDGGGEKHCVSN